MARSDADWKERLRSALRRPNTSYHLAHLFYPPLVARSTLLQTYTVLPRLYARILEHSYCSKKLQFGSNHGLHCHLSLTHQVKHVRSAGYLQAVSQRLHVRLPHLGVDVELAHAERNG